MKDDYTLFITESISKIDTDPKKFWSYIKSKKGDNNVPKRMSFQNVYYDEVDPILEAFANHFSKSYRISSNVCSSPNYNLCSSDTLNIKNVDNREVIDAIKSLKSTYTTGPDKVPSYIVKEYAEIFSIPLSFIFNLSLSTSKFPIIWKQSHVVPIHKQGDKTKIENYRAVCLISNFAKVFEILLYKLISEHTKHCISNQQHGFVSGRSTVTNLSCFTQYVCEAFNGKQQVDVVYTDLAKAFDRVDHKNLISKLSRYGLSMGLMNLFESYLSHRSQCVTYNGLFSMSYVALSGVPQGSVLGPLLFNLYINDIVDELSVPSLLYADDMKLYLKVSSTADVIHLQANVSKMFSWCINNGLDLNTDKCYILSYTNKNKVLKYAYTIVT